MGDCTKGAGPMEYIADIFKAFWREIKFLYNFYLMLLGVSIGAFCYFVDGNAYKKKGLKREKTVAKVTGVVFLVLAVGLYILVSIF
jgi:hypothetical protein